MKKQEEEQLENHERRERERERRECILLPEQEELLICFGSERSDERFESLPLPWKSPEFALNIIIEEHDDVLLLLQHQRYKS
jgi:hypothetical protein